MKPVKLLIAYLLGLFIVPVLCAATPAGAQRFRWIDGIYGNHQDGIGGDFAYRNLWMPEQGWFIRTFPRFWWSAIRNPAHNLGARLGASGTVIAIKRNKSAVHELGHYRCNVAVIDEHETVTRHYFYYGIIKWPFIDRYIRYAIGPKLWENMTCGDVIQSNYALSVLPFLSGKYARQVGINTANKGG